MIFIIRKIRVRADKDQSASSGKRRIRDGKNAHDAEDESSVQMEYFSGGPHRTPFQSILITPHRVYDPPNDDCGREYQYRETIQDNNID